MSKTTVYRDFTVFSQHGFRCDRCDKIEYYRTHEDAKEAGERHSLICGQNVSWCQDKKETFQ